MRQVQWENIARSVVKAAAAPSLYLKMPVPITNTLAPAATAVGAVRRSTPPSTSSSHRGLGFSIICRSRRIRSGLSGMKRLATEARVNSHAKGEIDFSQIRLKSVNWMVGIDGQPDFLAEFANGPENWARIGQNFLVDDKTIRPGFGEAVEEEGRIFDHQMNFEREALSVAASP